ncbi:MAG: chorismate mutase [Bacteroidota bacterium]
MKRLLEITPISDWLGAADRPIIVSGPCSVETEAQTLNTALEIARHQPIHLLRGGIWKPRTRPSSFEGVGAIGLPWLKRAGNAIGVPVTVEVANAQHVEACLEHQIDVLWIGARTTVNPFSVQEIADALRGVDIPVMVKNPVNPDLQLWLGALERVNQAGITRLAAVHRGFSSNESTPFRNAPNWQIPIELMSLCPELPLICDPSHIGGQRSLLAAIAQKAMDLNMDGLMIEAHIDPDNALSDRQQQVLPKALAALLKGLTVREADSSSREFRNQLESLRSLIDEVDEALLQKLSERMKIVEKIGEYKLENNVTILQIKRWNEILRSRTEIGSALGLTNDFILELLNQIHKESITRQTRIMNSRLEAQPSSEK